MYNEDRKVQFLTSTRESTDYGRSIFNTFAPYEEEAGLDVCDLPAETLQRILNSSFGLRTRSVETVIAFLKSYVGWCKERGITVGDGVYSLTVDSNDKIRRMMVSSPKHLDLILDRAFDPVSAGTVDCLYRCFLWMAFSGLEDADALTVKKSEIDFTSMLIEHDGKSYEMYREAIPAFKMACEATEFVYSHPNYRSIKKSRYPGEYLLCGIRSDQIKLTTIRSIVHKAFKANSIETSYGNIRRSGMFYRIYELERCGEEVSFNPIIEEQLAKKEHKYHRNFTRNKQANDIKRDLINDYERWKSAFSI